ncbi:MAG: hypothetical protein RL653_3062 [Pseudomonadota bacterium]|jgi:flagellar protein FliO/FliZ
MAPSLTRLAGLSAVLTYAVVLAAPKAPAAAVRPVTVDPAPVAAGPAPAPAEPVAVPAPPAVRTVRPEDTDAAVDRSLADLGVAPPPAKMQGAREGEPASLGWQLVQTLLTLGVVLGLVYLVLNVGLRKLMGGAALSAPGGAMVSVVARVPLEPRRTLYVLKAAGEYLLVSSSETGVILLSKLDAAEAERLQSAGQAPGAGLSPFLQKLLARRGSPPPEA